MYMDKKILRFQHHLFHLSEKNKFYAFSCFNKIYAKNLYFRFIAVNKVLINFSTFFYIEKGFFSKMKFHVVFNLRKNFSSLVSGWFFLSKNFGRILFCDCPSVYYLSIQSLWNIILSPFFEVYNDRYSVFFRPFRTYVDSFFFFKKNILKDKKLFFFYQKKFFLYPFSSVHFFSKHFFLPLFVLKSWLKVNSDIQRKSFILDSFIIRENLYFSFFNFLINGLVRFFFLIFKFF